MYCIAKISKHAYVSNTQTQVKVSKLRPFLVRMCGSFDPHYTSPLPAHQQNDMYNLKNVKKGEGLKKVEKKKELVINTKYDKCSDPMYQHLLYSTELDVFQTVKRGKIWLEKVYARKLEVERELRTRQLAAEAKGSIPVAMEYLYGGSNVVQRDKPEKEETIEANTLPLMSEDELQQELEKLYSYEDTYGKENVDVRKKEYPFSLYTDIDKERNVDLMLETNLLESGSSQEESPSEAQKDRRGRGTRRGRSARARTRLNQEEQIVERVPEHDIIGNDFLNPEIRQVFSEDHLFKHGTPNPDAQRTGIPCGGCGAELHCNDEKMPGYIPSEILEAKSNKKEELRSTLCQRCYFIKEYNVALKVTVAPEDYPKTIQHIKDKQALVILVVDLTDFPGSVWPNILDLLGRNKKIILVGNKLDLILPDHSKYINNITEVMVQEFLNKCRSSEDGGHVFPHLVSAMCVSARSGHNIEVLIDKVFRYWRWNNNSLPGDIYIVGCTNVGKSSIFNALIESDLCKIRAVDIMSRAMTSPVPGTTLDLLKFPVTRPEPNFINDRSKRLKQYRSAFTQKEEERLTKLQRYKKVDYAIPSHFSVTHTLKNALKEQKPKVAYLPSMEVEKKEDDIPEVMDPDSEYFKAGKWCYDTPGTVCEDQIINILTAPEIDLTLPSAPLMPRSFLLRQGHSLLLGGVARLDYVMGWKENGSPKSPVHPVRLTVFCSSKLPISVMETQGVEDFLANPQAWKLTQVPSGTLERMREFPKFLGREINTTGIRWNIGCRDIVLSSAGWAMVTTPVGEKSSFIAYTPGGKGIAERQPFLPYSCKFRGKRIQGSPTYRNDRLYLDYIEHKHLEF